MARTWNNEAEPVKYKPDTAAETRLRQWLLDFTLFARGDPSLTNWEEEFLATLTRMTQPFNPLPSDKQREKITQIATKLSYPQGVEMPPAMPPPPPRKRTARAKVEQPG